MTTGQQIKQARTAQKLSAKDLAKLVGVTASTVRRWEAGTILVPQERLIVLRTIFPGLTGVQIIPVTPVVATAVPTITSKPVVLPPVKTSKDIPPVVGMVITYVNPNEKWVVTSIDKHTIHLKMENTNFAGGVPHYAWNDGTYTIVSPTAPVVAKKPLLNRVAIIVDRSGSMGHLWNDVKALNTKLVEDFRTKARETGQRTDLITVSFNSRVDQAVYEIDIAKHFGSHPGGLASKYCDGGTALWDAVKQGVGALAVGTGDEHKYDVSYLVIVLTDGEENSSTTRLNQIQDLIREKNATDVWTFAFQLPPRSKQAFCAATGISEGNVTEWEATTKGVNNVFAQTSVASNGYFVARSLGKRSTQSFYTNMADKTPRDIKAALDAMSDISGRCSVLSANKECDIRSFVESKVGSFVKGAAFYQLVKPEREVQDYKKLIVTEVGKPGIFCGTTAARRLLGLPEHGTVKIIPGDHAGFEIFVQSTSVNRLLPAGTKVVYAPSEA